MVPGPRVCLSQNFWRRSLHRAGSFFKIQHFDPEFTDCLAPVPCTTYTNSKYELRSYLESRWRRQNRLASCETSGFERLRTYPLHSNSIAFSHWNYPISMWIIFRKNTVFLKITPLCGVLSSQGVRAISKANCSHRKKQSPWGSDRNGSILV